MRVTKATPWRLDLAHKTMVPMLVVGLVSVGYGIKVYLDGTGGWQTYLGSGLCLVMGLAIVLMACNSYVVFDKATQTFAARHRYLLATRYSFVDLTDIEAVVINTDSILGNALSVICIRVGGSDLPITMFGSPFAAAVHHQARRIAAFMDLPLLEKDRLVLKSAEDSAQDAIQDAYGKAVSRILLDGQRTSRGRGR